MNNRHNAIYVFDFALGATLGTRFFFSSDAKLMFFELRQHSIIMLAQGNEIQSMSGCDHQQHPTQCNDAVVFMLRRIASQVNLQNEAEGILKLLLALLLEVKDRAVEKNFAVS